MCGICGIFDLQRENRIDEAVLGRMLDAIRHRGPDGSRTMVLPRVGLGFNHLRLLDRDADTQPLRNEDKSIAVVCDGAIFNARELRLELEAAGHMFRTESDLEVIVHLYEECGLDFPKRLNGQFAIALYDGRKNELLLVRDQVGICSLFYTVAGGRVIFASEIKAILEHPGVERKLNLKALDQLMNFPGLVSPVTFFDGVHSMEGGHIVRFRPGQESENIEYWDLRFPEEEEDKGEAYYAEGLRERLKAAIEKRLVADVPVGFYISGGLDSSVVACFIGQYLMNSHYSFSAEMGSADLDESRFQRIVQERFPTNHFSTKITETELWKNLPQVIYHAETGVKESYDVAAYLLSAMVRETPVKAVLTGQGSDEFLCGYVGYMMDMFRRMQKDAMSPEECALNEMLWGDPYFRYERDHPSIRKIHRQVYSGDLRGELDKFSALATSPIRVDRVQGLSSQKRRNYIDYKLRLSDHLLGEHGDRMFAANSIGGRHPFLDKDVLDFVTTIPDKYKLRGSNEKYILKKAAEGIVPEEILKRRKFPFQAPGMSAMMKQAEGMAFLDDSLLKKHGIFDVDYVNTLKQVYSQSDFKLMGAYEIDYLLIVMTVTMLCEKYSLSI